MFSHPSTRPAGPALMRLAPLTFPSSSLQQTKRSVDRHQARGQLNKEQDQMSVQQSESAPGSTPGQLWPLFGRFWLRLTYIAFPFGDRRRRVDSLAGVRVAAAAHTRRKSKRRAKLTGERCAKTGYFCKRQLRTRGQFAQPQTPCHTTSGPASLFTSFVFAFARSEQCNQGNRARARSLCGTTCKIPIHSPKSKNV